MKDNKLNIRWVLLLIFHLDEEIGGKPGTVGDSSGTEVGLGGSISEDIDDGGELAVDGVDEIGGKSFGNLLDCNCEEERSADGFVVGVGKEEEGVITLELRFGSMGFGL